MHNKGLIIPAILPTLTFLMCYFTLPLYDSNLFLRCGFWTWHEIWSIFTTCYKCLQVLLMLLLLSTLPTSGSFIIFSQLTGSPPFCPLQNCNLFVVQDTHGKHAGTKLLDGGPWRKLAPQTTCTLRIVVTVHQLLIKVPFFVNVVKKIAKVVNGFTGFCRCGLR